MSLLGKWELQKEGSDYFPGLDTIPHVPIILKLDGNIDKESFTIERRKILDLEEIILTYSSRQETISRTFQIGPLNFEEFNHGTEVILSIIQEVNDDFSQFAISRLGPKPAQTSRETYQLDKNSGNIKLTIELLTEEGTRLIVTRYLKRFADGSPIETSSKAAEEGFQLVPPTIGWKLYEFWPSTTLSSTTVTVVQVVKLKLQDSNAKIALQSLGPVWTKQNNGIPIKVDFPPGTIITKIGHENFEGQESFYFVLEVTAGEKVWYVAHRYSSFNVLRIFLLNQNPANNEFKTQDSQFPGKAVGLSYRQAALEHRVAGLEFFVNFYLKNATLCRQASIDALHSFLQIPEHMLDLAKQKLAMEPIVDVVIEDLAMEEEDDPVVEKAGIFNTGIFPTITNNTETTNNNNTVTTNNTHTHDTPTPINNNHITQNNMNTHNNNHTTTTTTTATTNTMGAIVVVEEVDPEVEAKKLLVKRLGTTGIKILKYGRHGSPKNRLLLCNPDVSQLIIQADDHFKIVKLSGILGIRLGTDIDPSTIPAVADTPTSKDSNNNNNRDSKQRKSSVRRSFLFGGDNGPQYGTAILRKQANKEDMGRCLSLILATRSIDFLFTTEEELRLVYDNLRVLCRASLTC